MSDENELPLEEPADDNPQDSAVDPKQRQRKILEKKLSDRDIERHAQEYIFGTEAGRKFIWGILSEAHVFEIEFACGPNGAPQGEATFFKLGEQMLGQRLYQTWHAKFPEQVMLMLKENDHRFQVKKGS